MESKYMIFVKLAYSGKTELWEILSRSSGVALGYIKWYGPWRQYCFFPNHSTLFNVGCMQDIIKKIKSLMQQRKDGH